MGNCETAGFPFFSVRWIIPQVIWAMHVSSRVDDNGRPRYAFIYCRTSGKLIINLMIAPVCTVWECYLTMVCASLEEFPYERFWVFIFANYTSRTHHTSAKARFGIPISLILLSTEVSSNPWSRSPCAGFSEEFSGFLNFRPSHSRTVFFPSIGAVSLK